MTTRLIRPQTTAVAMAGVSVATARSIKGDPRPPSARKETRQYRTRPNSLEGLRDEAVIPMLEAAPGLRPITVLAELDRRHPRQSSGHWSFTADAFEQACINLKVSRSTSKPYTPQTNGMDERFNGRVASEVLGINVAGHADLEMLLLGFNHAYN